jgi:G3E family GTPase
MKNRLPYTVIGGYLGAGKTTLLNNLLRNSQGLRLAVLVNDFGDINIDVDLIASHDGETINLVSGCICCSLADGFMLALNQLSKRASEIDHIIVEASGVSDPRKIGQYGAILKLDLEGVIVLVDAEQIGEKATNKYVGDTVIRQLQGADLLVLNKVDLVTQEQLQSVRDWLTTLVPRARIVEAVDGQVPLPVLLGTFAVAAPAADELADYEVQNEHDHASAPSHEEAHQDMYRTWSFAAEAPIRRDGLQELLDTLPEGVLRSKGFVYLADDSDRCYLLQMVGKRWKLTAGEPWAAAKPGTKLVFIGLPGSLKPANIENRLLASPKMGLLMGGGESAQQAGTGHRKGV